MAVSLDTASSAGTGAADAAPAQLAKAALRRLALDRLEPTPENFARAYEREGGKPAAPAATASAADAGPADAAAWALLFERAVRGLERGGRQWTTARKKESLQRVLSGSRSDPRRLLQRLTQLVTSWDGDTANDPSVELVADEAAADAAIGVPSAAVPDASAATSEPQRQPAPQGADASILLAAGADAPPPAIQTDVAGAWPRVADELGATVQAALPDSEPRGREVAGMLQALQTRLRAEGPDAVADELAVACAEARRLLQHRHSLVGALGTLCGELTEGLVDLAEDDSWAQGQCVAVRAQLFEADTGVTARGVRAAGELLRGTRERQQQLKRERGAARTALKASIREMLDEIASLGARSGRFSQSMDHYADAIEHADSLESLAGTVRELVAESRSVHADVIKTQARLASGHERALGMQERVTALELEIQRLSNEVSTDPLTQIANRRGLQQAFETECARQAREVGSDAAAAPLAALAVCLIDIDNFKRLNDRLGHANGDAALQFLTQRVTQALRPGDTLARYGGEEFVVLLPSTPTEEAQKVLTRLQRNLSAELFMSDAQGQVFVTFSAGVTPYRPGERLEAALERADEALYEAKRTGKNRTCVA